MERDLPPGFEEWLKLFVWHRSVPSSIHYRHWIQEDITSVCLALTSTGAVSQIHALIIPSCGPDSSPSPLPSLRRTHSTKWLTLFPLPDMMQPIDYYGYYFGGMFISLMFHGGVLAQASYYLSHYSKDSMVLKGFVLFLMDFGHHSFMIMEMYLMRSHGILNDGHDILNGRKYRVPVIAAATAFMIVSLVEVYEIWIQSSGLQESVNKVDTDHLCRQPRGYTPVGIFMREKKVQATHMFPEYFKSSSLHSRPQQYADYRCIQLLRYFERLPRLRSHFVTEACTGQALISDDRSDASVALRAAREVHMRKG
ncbi:hypothetical protein WOLCODRAFT_20016 [Wolfiporia cocos MD-104 SS10]|uniref:Uncharacterized protein n=1 Tax=Wolfiporia cocos (strain MD-104) TaxID=742152 RepID=A0A2H3JFN6_WOLCO|nr:hypothetical protein WOLCODRAFT_20016 [Wolfiporia cocos MD-104 SS10]